MTPTSTSLTTLLGISSLALLPSCTTDADILARDANAMPAFNYVVVYQPSAPVPSSQAMVVNKQKTQAAPAPKPAPQPAPIIAAPLIAAPVVAAPAKVKVEPAAPEQEKTSSSWFSQKQSTKDEVIPADLLVEEKAPAEPVKPKKSLFSQNQPSTPEPVAPPVPKPQPDPVPAKKAIASSAATTTVSSSSSWFSQQQDKTEVVKPQPVAKPAPAPKPTPKPQPVVSQQQPKLLKATVAPSPAPIQAPSRTFLPQQQREDYPIMPSRGRGGRGAYSY